MVAKNKNQCLIRGGRAFLLVGLTVLAPSLLLMVDGHDFPENPVHTKGLLDQTIQSLGKNNRKRARAVVKTKDGISSKGMRPPDKSKASISKKKAKKVKKSAKKKSSKAKVNKSDPKTADVKTTSSITFDTVAERSEGKKKKKWELMVVILLAVVALVASFCFGTIVQMVVGCLGYYCCGWRQRSLDSQNYNNETSALLGGNPTTPPPFNPAYSTQ